jgi:DNA anti-recombination protein RmuC
MSTPAKSGAAEAVLSGVTTLLEKFSDSIKEFNTIRFQELEIDLKEIKNMLQAMQKVTSGAKKTTKAEASGETAAKDAPVASTATKSAVPNNSLLWFKLRYAADEEFRNKYTTPAMKTALADDKSIKGTGEARYKTEAAKVWNLLKDLESKTTDPNSKLMSQFKEEFEQAKKAAAETPAQQNAEPTTP